MICQQIQQHLTQTEIAEIDVRAIAKVVLNITITLSLKINKEIIESISKWIDDPDFMKKHKVMIDDGARNWADYNQTNINQNGRASFRGSPTKDLV